MHLYLRIALLMTFALVGNSSEMLRTHREAKQVSYDQEVEDISQGFVTLRDGRRLKSKPNARLNFGILDSLLDIIDFSNGNCSTGMCMSQKECAAMNGTDSGIRCVEGFGVCCESTGGYEGGNVTIGPDGGAFLNPEGLDGGRPTGTVDATRLNRQEEVIEEIKETITYTATLNPPADAVQMMITINSLNIIGPDEGDCVNDTLVISGANPGLEIPSLCGVISDQILYIDIDNSEGPFTVAITLLLGVDDPAEWSISVSFLTEADAVERRCLQYHTATNGTIESFNFDLDKPGMMLNEQTYSICFGYVVGFCDIAFNFARLDLGRLDGVCTNNYLLIGDNKYCGDSVDLQIQANATGPINIGVRSGGVNEIEEEGFKATYTMMGC